MLSPVQDRSRAERGCLMLTIVLPLPHESLHPNASQLCSFPGCDNPRIGRKTLCEAHYCQLLRKGTLSQLKDTRRWSASEICLLRNHYFSCGSGKVNLKNFAKSIGRPHQNVCRKARQLGLTDVHRRWHEPPQPKYATTEER